MTLASLSEGYGLDLSPPLPLPVPAPPPTGRLRRALYLGFISTLEVMSSASRSYSSTWPLVHTFMRSVSSLLRGARMKS